MDTLHQMIENRIRRTKSTHVFIAKDFLDLGERAAVDQVLSRLARTDYLHRVGRGLYYSPRKNPRLGIIVPPNVDELAQALGRQTGSRIVPSGAVAANRLGLSTQVPAKPLYLSNGRTRRVRVAGNDIHIKHVPPKELPAGRPTSAMVFQALRHLGPQATKEEVISTLRRALSPKQRRELLEDARYTTDWIADMVRKVIAEEGEAAHG